MVPDLKLGEILGPIVLAVIINVSPLLFGVVGAHLLVSGSHPASSFLLLNH